MKKRSKSKIIAKCAKCGKVLEHHDQVSSVTNKYREVIYVCAGGCSRH